MEPVSRRRWLGRGKEPAPALLQALCAGLGISPLTARALVGRGIATVTAGSEFFDSRLASLPDPLLLPGMPIAADRLATAVARGEKIAVHGDYDVDGITGTALLTETLRALGAEVVYHIPLRLRDGYGLSAEAIRHAAAAGARVIVSVDCGISAVEEAALAASLGLDLVITDHHQPPEILPAACAIVNPALPGSLFPSRELAGVGVAFFFLVALRKVLREQGFFRQRAEPDLRLGLDLVALGTIADVVPLRHVNRLLVKAGLGVLANGCRPGLQALKKVAAVEEVTCGAVAFRLAPRLNAAGRLEDAALGVELLLAEEPARATEIAELLDGFNRERQQIEAETLQQAIERLDRGEGQERVVVLADSRWHPGVIGIVASRLVERYHRPTVLIALGEGGGKGSARSVAGFHLYQALQRCAGFLEGFGGHECAAGLTIAEERIPAFAEALDQVAREVLKEEDLLPCYYHDGEVLLEEISPAVVQEIASLAPFGAGNPEPLFIARGVRSHQLRPVGTNHLRFTARQGGYSFSCIGFGLADRAGDLQGELDLLFTPVLNDWRGAVAVNLRIKDYRQAQ